MQLQDKIALVTGGSQRVGRAISIGLAQHGAKVALHYHHSEKQARETVHHIEAAGGEAFPIAGNFARLEEVRRTVKKCVAHFGGIDVLINNAAVYFETPFGSTTEDEWEQLFAVNLKAPFLCCQEAAKIMRKQQSGKIVNISDVAGILPWADHLPYCATKASLISVTKGLAKALAPHIQVNAVASGTVLLADDASSEFREKIENGTLLKRIGSPQDIVNTVLFLLTGSDYVTGSVIPVDGGKLLA